MRILIIEDDCTSSSPERPSLLWGMLSDRLLGPIIGGGLAKTLPCDRAGEPVRVLVPAEWALATDAWPCSTSTYEHAVCLGPDLVQSPADWVTVVRTPHVARFEPVLLRRTLKHCSADLLAVYANPQLTAPSEVLRLADETRVAGYRRVHECLAEPAIPSQAWPEVLFIRAHRLQDLPHEGRLEGPFRDYVMRLEAQGISCEVLRMGGVLFDLRNKGAVLDWVRGPLAKSLPDLSVRNGEAGGMDDGFSEASGIWRPILRGREVHVGKDALLLGPVLLGDAVHVGEGVVLDTCVVGHGHRIDPGRVVRGRVLVDSRDREPAGSENPDAAFLRSVDEPGDGERRMYRSWPAWSYPGCIKRAVDIAFALAVLLLFAPILPFVALAVKLSSAGPVFYRARRQGLHGKVFNCLKFRTMRVDAESLQDNLRDVNQVDGPQFKLEDDPRTTPIGRFLRETCIDEIPQFFNVLWGQMSVVGPRPSPESENTQCRPWRDARLSVRPGITGLWQVCRTRLPGRDFQEWIRYDVQYVRHLSWKMDLSICVRTFMMLVDKFIEQF